MIRLSRRALLGSACPLFAVGLGLYACGDDSVATVDEGAVLKDVTEIIARPSYAAWKAASDELKVALDAFVASPSEATLGAAQENWKTTVTSWNQTRTFTFGTIPVPNNGDAIYWHLGADFESIEEEISAGGPFDIPGLGTNRKGLPALEYLLFDPEGGNAAIMEKFSASADRVAFVGALAADLSAQIDAQVSAWQEFAGQLATAGEGSEAYKSPKDGMDALYNQLLYVADLMIAQIKAPLLGTSGSLNPDLEEARLSDNTLPDTFAQMAALNSVYEGTYGEDSGLGISALIKDRSPELDDLVRTAIADGKSALEAIPPPLREALQGDTGVLQTAVDKLRELKKLLTGDAATALGVSVTFSDMDGD